MFRVLRHYGGAARNASRYPGHPRAQRPARMRAPGRGSLRGHVRLDCPSVVPHAMLQTPHCDGAEAANSTGRMLGTDDVTESTGSQWIYTFYVYARRVRSLRRRLVRWPVGAARVARRRQIFPFINILLYMSGKSPGFVLSHAIACVYAQSYTPAAFRIAAEFQPTQRDVWARCKTVARA